MLGLNMLVARAWIRGAKIISDGYYLRTDKTGDSPINIGRIRPSNILGRTCDVRISVYERDGRRFWSGEARLVS